MTPNPFEIIPSYEITGDKDPILTDLLVQVMQKIVDSAIPDELKEEVLRHPKDFDRAHTQLNRLLPLLTHSPLDPQMNVLTVTLICPAQYTRGVGRYLIETLSQWLIPGHPLSNVSTLSLNFQFKHHPPAKFYVVQNGVSVNSQEEFLNIQKNLSGLMSEMRINMLSVYHARYVSSLRGLSTNYKNLIIQENLSSLLNQPFDEIDQTIYDQMQGFIRKIDAEERMDQVKKNIAHLLQARPEIFDRNVFYEMNNITHLFSGSFGHTRDPKHLGRIIAYQYLFKKILQDKTEQPSIERHLSTKILRTVLEGKRHVLSVLIGLNLVKESERFEIRNLLEAIRASLPDVSYVEGSLIADRRHEKIRFFYLEVEKPSPAPFSQEEIKRLKFQLPSELTRQIENVTHPIFMPRNEEELMRNLIGLSKQLKYIRDLPQVSIHYEKQTDTELFFTVLLVRLIKKDHATIYQLIKNASTCLKIDIDDLRNMGVLRQKYPKEAVVLRICIEKRLFFRLDHSVDLLRARQKIALEMNHLLGEFRDFNGGMILKQDEALQQLRQLIGTMSQHQELLLENYFYSLRPGTMPTIFEPQLLKQHFELLSESLALGHGITRPTEGFLLSFLYPVCSEHKEKIFQTINKLQLPPYSLTHASLQTERGLAVGFILRTANTEIEQAFCSAINECESFAVHH